MKIQSLRIREGGTHVDLDNAAYHFAPNAAGHHVADVTNSKHLSKLLATDAFIVYDPAEATALADEPTKQADTGGAGPIIAVADLDDMTDADLKAHYLALFGKAAGNKGRAKLIAELSAKLEARAAEIAATNAASAVAAKNDHDDFESDDEDDEDDQTGE